MERNRRKSREREENPRITSISLCHICVILLSFFFDVLVVWRFSYKMAGFLLMFILTRLYFFLFYSTYENIEKYLNIL